MIQLPRFLLIVFLCLAPLAGAEPSTAALEREMARVSAVAGGVVGATAIHIETGARAAFHGTVRFPMASTFKVPVALALLAKVDRGEERLDRLIELHESDLHPGSGTLTDLFNQPGVELSIRNLMELMLRISDNSAADVCLRLAGGPQAVTEHLRKLGLEDIDVSRPTLGLISDVIGVGPLAADQPYSPRLFRSLSRAVPPEKRQEAARQFDSDRRDTATPDAMAQLLVRLYKKELLKPESSELLLDIMRRCRTGAERIKGILPAGTEVAHKTGTIGGTADDVGVMTLPDGAGHVALAVLMKSSEKPAEARDRAIAEVARAAHDYFLFAGR